MARPGRRPAVRAVARTVVTGNSSRPGPRKRPLPIFGPHVRGRATARHPQGRTCHAAHRLIIGMHTPPLPPDPDPSHRRPRRWQPRRPDRRRVRRRRRARSPRPMAEGPSWPPTPSTRSRTATSSSSRTAPSPRAGAAHDLAARYSGTVTATYGTAVSGFTVTLSEKGARRLAANPAVASVEQDRAVAATDTQSGADRGVWTASTSARCRCRHLHLPERRVPA